jgi:hypothetical protein
MKTKQFTLPGITPHGEAWMIVNLSRAEDPGFVVAQLQELGYEPELLFQRRETPNKVYSRLVALLRRDTFNGEIPPDYGVDEMEQIAQHVDSSLLLICRGEEAYPSVA